MTQSCIISVKSGCGDVVPGSEGHLASFRNCSFEKNERCQKRNERDFRYGNIQNNNLWQYRIGKYCATSLNCSGIW